MSKFLKVMGIATLAILVAAPAMALDFKFGGEYRVRMYDGTNIGFVNGATTNSRGAQIRVRPIFDVADDNGNITARMRLEIGDVEFGNGGGAASNTWGVNAAGGTASYKILGGAAQQNLRTGNGAGGALGADGVSVEVKSLYLDFALPFGMDKYGRVRAGLQGWYLPKGILVDDDVAGIRIYGNVNPVSYDLGWFRAQGGADTGSQTVYCNTAGAVTVTATAALCTGGGGTVLSLTQGTTMASTSNALDNNYDFWQAKADFNLSPMFKPGVYYLYGVNKAGSIAAAAPWTDEGADSHYIGFTATGKIGTVSYDADFIWGSAEGGPNGTLYNTISNERIKTQGYALDVHAAVPVGPVTVNLAASYATGDKQNGGKSEAFPSIAPSWNGAGGGFEMIGSGGPFDAVEFTQDYMTNLWMIGGWIEYVPVKALWLKAAYGYAGFAQKEGNCAVAQVTPGAPCYGPKYFGTNNEMVGKSRLGQEISLRADYTVWTGFKLQAQLGWLIPSGGETAGEYVLQMLYNF